MRIEEYLQTLTQQIRCRKAHPMIRREYRSHIEEQMEEFIRCGMDRQEAEQAAVAQMGDPVEAGVALDSVHKPKLCVSVMITVLALTVAGIVMQAVLFAGSDNAYIREVYLGRSIVYNLIGLCIMALVCYVDYSFLYKHTIWLYAAWLVLMFLLVFASEHMWISGFSWMTYQSLCYQLTALFYPLAGVILFRCRRQGIQGFCKAAGLMLLALLAFLYTGKVTGRLEGYVILLVLSGFAFFKGWYGRRGAFKAVVLWAAGILAPVCYVLWMLSGNQHVPAYRAVRIKAFFHPESDATGAGFMTMQIRQLLSHMTLIGHAKNLEIALPNAHNDFILISIFAYFGVAVGVFVCGLFLFFFVRVFYITWKQKNQMAFMVGMACALELLLRGGIYMLSNFGVSPVAQMSLPFMSFGLLSSVGNAILTGLLLSIYRYEDVFDERQMCSFPQYRLKVRLEKVDQV